MSDETYNGYANWDTWEAYNLITSYPNLYEDALDVVRCYDHDDLDDSGTMSVIRDDLAPIVEELVIYHEADVNADRVHWGDLADSLIG